MELTASNVQTVFMDCLFSDKDIENDRDGVEARAIKVQGITLNVGFDPTKIEASKSNIRKMLEQLPLSFRETEKGGWSFLQACKTKEDVQWGEHISMEQLFCLGMATSQVGYLLPREQWHILPGKMPYLFLKF